MEDWLEVQYPVMEHFLTVQGEGAYTGVSAFFIRLGGCDVGCSWCDVKESWDVNAHPKLTVRALLEEAKSSNAPICVVTGGEPAMHDLNALTTGLHSIGMRTHIETSGTHQLTGKWDWVTFSPKRFKEAVQGIHQVAQELKVIVVNRQDIGWGEEHAELMTEEAKLYFQPEWDRQSKVLPYIMNHLKTNPRWRLSLQSHKYLGLP
ncbi:MAG: 7-carboxy-7-deazaguanine synthase QueE [Bacteroidetes bacterium]|nr:7-carboxy-7-deazaguanine synthase QueE [Bacteroidota bacterium]MDA1335614.1 7-carboxy-7-deazaguanine synthase QueE [Bacteroidota bacterium]